MRKLDNLFALYESGMRMGSLQAMLRSKKVMDSDIGVQLFQCNRSLEYVISGTVLQLPRSTESAIELIKAIGAMLNGDPGVATQQYQEPLNAYFTGPIYTNLDTFQIALSEELKLLPLFSVEAKGNLSVDKLVDGASTGYPASTLTLLDAFITREIDEAGRCLAFARPPACGFHILRSVEIAVKAYVLAATGTLPKMTQRNWGEYIGQLSNAGASSNLIDLLTILKAKRNPLMHPQDTLEIEDAIGIFCVCQNVTETLITEVRSKGLDAQFTNALAALPTI